MMTSATIDNGFYILVIGIIIGIVVSYSNLLSFFLGLGLGYLATHRNLFDYINDQVNKFTVKEN